MPYSRYTYRTLFRNRLRTYREQLRARNVNSVSHYSSPDMLYPNAAQKSTLNVIKHIWKHGDRYYKLADKYFGDKNLWWVIAWYNLAPTESHMKMGDVVRIPLPLEAALSYLRER